MSDFSKKTAGNFFFFFFFTRSRCVSTQRALLESGTMGPKGHVQVRRSLANVPLLGFAVLSVFIIVTEIKIVAVVYNLYSIVVTYFFLPVVNLAIIFYSQWKKKKKIWSFNILRGYSSTMLSPGSPNGDLTYWSLNLNFSFWVEKEFDKGALSCLGLFFNLLKLPFLAV